MAKYTKSMLLRLSDEQHEQLESEARAAGLSAQSYVRDKLFPNDPTAISSTPTNAAHVATVDEVKRLRNSLNALYARAEAGFLTHQPPADVLQRAFAEGQAALTGKELPWQHKPSPVAAKRSKRSSQ